MEEIHHKNSSVFGGFFFCGTEKKDARVEKYIFGKKKGGMSAILSVTAQSVNDRPGATPTPPHPKSRRGKIEMTKIR